MVSDDYRKMIKRKQVWSNKVDLKTFIAYDKGWQSLNSYQYFWVSEILGWFLVNYNFSVHQAMKDNLISPKTKTRK